MAYNIYVKNMVCPRCVKVLSQELQAQGIAPEHVEIGLVALAQEPSPEELRQIEHVLNSNGFEILPDRKRALVEQMKILIIEKINSPEDIEEGFQYSAYLSEKTGMEYHYLSALFSSVEPLTIEKFIIHQRIEKAKELLRYGRYTLSEISYKLGYSSVHYLSNQFKKVTGMTPTEFKNLRSIQAKT